MHDEHTVLQRAMHIDPMQLASLAHTGSRHRIAALRQHGVAEHEDPVDCHDAGRNAKDA